MKTNKILICLLMALPTLLLTSCLKDQSDTFDGASANRVQDYLNETKQVLISSEQGWAFEYYPDRQQSYGGYQYTVRFTEDSVYARTEMADAAKEYASLYKMGTDNGPIISFDTYNEALHYFATPSSQLYEAYDGDFEFIILNISEDKNTITLKGKRSGTLSYLHRLTGEVTAEDYISSIKDMASKMSFKYYTIVSDTDTIEASVRNRNLMFTDKEGNDVSAPFIYTLDGIKFYNDVTIFGQEISGIKFETGVESFQPTTSASLSFIPVVPPLNVQIQDGEWYIAYSQLGAFAQGYWSQMQTKLAGVGEQLYYAYLGTSEGEFGLHFASYDGSGLYGGGLLFDVTTSEDSGNIITMKFAMKGLGDGVWYHNNAGFAYALEPFGYSTSRTFTLEADSETSPTYIIMTEEGNPTNQITLSASEILWPFDN
jgi:hypothetical protein